MKINIADKWCSRFARIKDAFLSNGILVTKCVTCGKIKECKDVECGHYVSRKHMGTRYSELNTHPQCTYCNRWKYGEPEKYALYLNERYGIGTAERLRMESVKPAKVDTKLMATYYRELVNNLIEQRGWQAYKWW